MVQEDEASAAARPSGTPPGHLWRDKWTALSRPLSYVDHSHGPCEVRCWHWLFGKKIPASSQSVASWRGGLIRAARLAMGSPSPEYSRYPLSSEGVQFDPKEVLDRS